MTRAGRYAGLLRLQLRTSILLALQYRVELLLDGFFSLFWTVTALVPLALVFRERPVIAGWQFGEALLVTGWFTLLSGVLEGAINPSLTTVVEHIRKGTLDFVLLKPADAQFLVSTAKFLPWRVVNVLSAGVIFVWAFSLVGRTPSVVQVGASLALLCASIALLYSLWILIVSAAFLVVKVDNLTYLFGAVFDAARWPVSVFRGVLRAFFTFVVPLAVMTTFPAQALLGRLDLTTLIASLCGSLVFAVAARLAWLASLRRYTSASS